MKIYKIEDNNTPFINKEAFDFKSFDVTSGISVIHSVENNIKYVENSNIGGWMVHKSMFGWPKHDVYESLKIKMPVLSLYKTDNPEVYYTNGANPQEYSKIKRDNDDTLHDYFQINCISENYIRQFYGTDTFMYVNFPVQFFRDYLERIICNTQMQNFYQAMSTVTDFSVHSLIDTFNKYDKIYTDTTVYEGANTNKPPYYYRWRRDLFLPMVYSIKQLGYFNPALTRKSGSVFFDGSHRLGVGTGLGFDYPLFIPLDKKLQIDKGKYVLSTVGVFKDETALLMEVDVNEKTIKGWWYTEEDMENYFTRFNYDPNEALHLEHPINAKKYHKEYSEKPHDILFTI